MKKWKFLLPVVVGLFVIFFNGCSTRSVALSRLKSGGEVIKEYDQGEDHYLVVKRGYKITKFRLYASGSGLSSGTGMETVYSIDTVAESCLTGSYGQTPISCED